MTLPIVVLISATIVLMTVCILLLHSLFRSYRKPPQMVQPDQTTHPSFILEAIWAIIPVLLILMLLALTFQAVR